MRRDSCWIGLVWVLSCSSIGIAETGDNGKGISTCELKMVAENGMQADNFGWSVAIDGDITIVGAPRQDYNGFNSGLAYVFERQADGSWLEAAILDPSNGGGSDSEWYGFSVAVSTGTAVVGARFNSDQGHQAGAANVFERQADGSWIEVAVLTGFDTTTDDEFGYSVAIKSEIIVVGARTDDNTHGLGAGSAYVFERQRDGSWIQIAKLTATDGSFYDQFGSSVSVDGAVIVVGSWHDDNSNGSLAGSAYVYDRLEDGSWLQVAKLLASNGGGYDYFGQSVDLDGDTILVGAPKALSYKGSAYVFQRQPDNSWFEVAFLLPLDIGGQDNFGVSVSLSGGLAVVGSYLDNHSDLHDPGSAYVFRAEGDKGWQEIAKLTASDASADDRLGISVSICDGNVVAGAFSGYNNDGLRPGAAYYFGPICPNSCPWDLNGDGVVGVSDLLILVGNFGPCDGECPADFDDDGFVGASDLLALIANFGECPGTGCPWDVNGDGVVDRLDVIAVNDNMGPCKDPDNCPWDVNGDGIVNGRDVAAVATHFGPCP